MDRLSRIATLALEALGDELDQTLALEKILRICIGKTNQESAKTAALEVREKVKNIATIKDFAVEHYKAKYGYFEGYPQFQLALDFFRMSNDLFFEKYKFNFVPTGKLYSEVKKLLEERMSQTIATQMMSPLVADNISSSLSDGIDYSVNSIVRGILQSGM
ncbi:hypothetical protein I6N96_08975 [Enterococcus sp. BWM-S5]|uniref:Uncharacterized protein n=1 Tax=Enterococcus larvae TaxID=2794352 RepID=A0ABS4CIM4_9ENTE|nr:hypothetical protein [Enterococcus larvae]MBP1046416.1 hypothetical protein [Enterococcus larvae]